MTTRTRTRTTMKTRTMTRSEEVVIMVSRKDISDEQVCLACVVAHTHESGTCKESSIEVLQRYTGAPFKVCRSAMDRACGRKLINYGVSLETSWVTDAGRELLRDSTALRIGIVVHLGETCQGCGKTFDAFKTLDDVVWWPHAGGRIGHKKCFEVVQAAVRAAALDQLTSQRERGEIMP